MSRGERFKIKRAKGSPRHVRLLVPPHSDLRVSSRGFWKLCQANRDLRLERGAKGELLVMTPAGAESGKRSLALGAQLWAWNQRAGLGVAFDSSAGFTLPNGAVRAPDAAWMTRARWETLEQAEREGFAHACPDFVAELRSPSDPLEPLREKMREYAAHGARLGWLIDPKSGTVEAYRPGRPVETLSQPATVSGDDVLPGFVLDLKGILFE